MQKEISIQEVEKTLSEDINDTIFVKRENKEDVVIMSLEEYKKIIEKNLIDKLKKAEEQIKNGEVTKAENVFAEMRSKYGYKLENS
jgi:PHD/YefM family antitoxin component YafN of YafNO toxin-antitoxin module